MDHVVVDVEIAKTIEQVGGWDATDKMGIGYAVVYEYKTDRFRVYGPEDADTLGERLLRADRITGFNIWNFDFPVIWGVARAEWPEATEVRRALEPKTDDILRRIWLALGLNPDVFEGSTHGGWGLNAVVGATMKNAKIGHGADAPVWFQEGRHAKVIEYCIDDVALERDLGEFIHRNGYVLNVKNGGLIQLPVQQWGTDSA